MYSWLAALHLLFVVLTTYGVDARVNSRAEYYPACYTHGSLWHHYNDSGHDCKHPLYTNCRHNNYTHLCCGPDHYCCEDAKSCCRRNMWTTYEVVGVITGGLSWLAILVILGICVGTRLVKEAMRYLRRKKKVFPH